MTRTNALESLVISGWVRGLSDRDITAARVETLGPEATEHDEQLHAVRLAQRSKVLRGDATEELEGLGRGGHVRTDCPPQVTVTAGGVVAATGR